MEKEYSGSEIYHHGIPGQKWGHKNGPPYPLDKSDYSAAEKRSIGDKLKYNRISSTMSLNDAAERKARQEFLQKRATQKFEHRKLRADMKLRNPNVSDTRKEKIKRKIDKEESRYNKQIDISKIKWDKQDKLIKDTIKELDRRGYNVYEAKTKRAVNYERQYVEKALGYFVFGGAARAVGGPFFGRAIGTLAVLNVSELERLRRDAIRSSKYAVN